MKEVQKFLWMPKEISSRADISDNEKKMLAYIHGNSTGHNPMSFDNDDRFIVGFLADETDMSTRDAEHALFMLEKRGLIEVTIFPRFRTYESKIDFDETRIPRNYYYLEELGVGIGFFAFGLYLYMLSLHPINEEGWFTIDVDELAESFGDKNTRIHKAINKLIQKGLLIRKPYRVDGKFFGQMYRATYGDYCDGKE